MPQSHPENTDRLVIEAMIHRDDALEVFHHLVEGIPLDKIKSPESYHITLGFIHSIHSTEIHDLKEYLKNFIDQMIQPIDIQQTICRAGQFSGNDAVVLFFENPMSLRVLSKTIRKHLLKYNGIDPYDYSTHSQPQNYKPHMTIGDGKRSSIKLINDKIKEANIPLYVKSTHLQARIIPR